YLLYTDRHYLLILLSMFIILDSLHFSSALLPYLHSFPTRRSSDLLHRGVVASGTDLPHRSDEVVTVQSVHELPRPKLRPAVRMHDAASDATAAGSGVVQGVHRQTRLHPGVHGVADDPAGEHVLDGAEVEL